jgi:hypothetical protein
VIDRSISSKELKGRTHDLTSQWSVLELGFRGLLATKHALLEGRRAVGRFHSIVVVVQLQLRDWRRTEHDGMQLRRLELTHRHRIFLLGYRLVDFVTIVFRDE